jgi:hypothetical protein
MTMIEHNLVMAGWISRSSDVIRYYVVPQEFTSLVALPPMYRCASDVGGFMIPAPLMTGSQGSAICCCYIAITVGDESSSDAEKSF